MSTTAVSTSPEPVPSVPDAGEVFAFARGEIAAAAADLWPGADIALDEHVPSVTGYVHRLRVDGQPLYAKYSLLGVSLVSLLRGSCGTGAQVLQQQQAYVRRADTLMKREAAQLRLLARVGQPRVCPVAGLQRGVLFTQLVAGPTLAELVLERPHEAVSLLETSFGELHRLHRPVVARLLTPAGSIAERSIRGTFQRKFNGISGGTYLGRLGAERCAPEDQPLIVALLRLVVSRLHRMPAPSPGTQRVLTYGDLKPEHVLFPDGMSLPPVFLDPGLLLATPVVDAAKLLSRTVLLLAAARPDPQSRALITRGLDVFATARMNALPAQARHLWLRELLVLWLMDSINILTTYLSAPAALPLPGQGLALVDRAGDLCRLADRISAQLAAGTDPGAVWDSALGAAAAVAA